jgi:apolipoprotein N-acyltransferase
LLAFLNNKFFILFLFPLLLGAITVFGFAPYNLTFINFFSFSLLLFFIFIAKKEIISKYKMFNKYYFYLGCSFGFGFFLFGNYWISISLTHDDSFSYLIPFSLIFIPLLLSLFFGIGIFLIGPFVEKNISFILLFSVVFSLSEFVRGNILTGFPWNLISYSWSWSQESIQVLSLIGTYSLSLISLTFFCFPFIFFQKKFIKKNFIFFSILLIIFITNYLYGFYKINEKNFIFDKNIKIKIVSPNFSLNDYSTESELTQLERLINLSNPDKEKKTVFIWPEGIFYESYLTDIHRYKDLFKKNFSDKHLIVLGINNFNETENLSNKKYFNSLVIIDNNLEITSVYNKINLVPFGEFLPFEKTFAMFGIKKLTKGYNSFSSGQNRELIELNKNFNEKLVLPLICYEIIYTGRIKEKNQFPDLVINISEDAWFGQSIGPHQHFSKAIYRAVEEGVFVARSANRGISALINPSGQVVKSLYTGESGSIDINFPQFYKQTLFSNYGNKIFYLIIFLYMFLILIFRKYKI